MNASHCIGVSGSTTGGSKESTRSTRFNQREGLGYNTTKANTIRQTYSTRNTTTPGRPSGFYGTYPGGLMRPRGPQCRQTRGQQISTIRPNSTPQAVCTKEVCQARGVPVKEQEGGYETDMNRPSRDATASVSCGVQGRWCKYGSQCYNRFCNFWHSTIQEGH